MIFRINGEKLEIETEKRLIGDILNEIDERAEAMDAVILDLSMDGRQVDMSELEQLFGKSASEPGNLDMTVRPIPEIKAYSLGILSDLLELAADISEKDKDELKGDLGKAWQSFKSAYYGLYSAEEISFLDAFGEAVDKMEAQLGTMAKKLKGFFRERLAELTEPEASMMSAAKLFDTIKNDLSEVSLKIQTGKDKEAMNTMVIVVELINKTVRILPSYLQYLKKTDKKEPVIDGLSAAEFYTSLNGVLKELAGAFENKDGILIGDLAEYEISPRLESFFTALAALGAKDGR
ncbi:hypothetical protein MASR2M29_11480 [Spirochaetota bacterium]